MARVPVNSTVIRKNMNDPRLVKKWKAIEIQLVLAAEFLLEPDRFELEQKGLKDYQEYLRENELELAMDELAVIAKEHGAKSGFWRRLQKTASNMELQNKVEEYEREFHDALSKNV